MRKVTTMVVTLALLVGTVGCYKKPVVPSVPGVPTATAPAETAGVKFQRTVLGGADAVSAISSGLGGVDASRKALLAAGSITPETSAKILAILKAAASKNETARVTCEMAAKTGDSTIPWQQRIMDVVVETKSLDPATLGFKNADSQAAFKASVSVLQLTVAAAEAAFALQNGGQ